MDRSCTQWRVSRMGSKTIRMKTLIFGGSGQVGTELKNLFQSDSNVRIVKRNDADFTKPHLVETLINDVEPTHIINAAAYTSVDDAEVEDALAFQVNAKAVNVLASCAARYDALFLHYSTDYVFDGLGNRPYQEIDAANPVTVYGQSKLKGEDFIQMSGCRHLILRTSWVVSATGKNFIKTILKHAQTKDQLTVVNDQIGAVTSAGLISHVTADLIRLDALTGVDSGIYHLCSSGEASWFDVAVYAISRAARKGVSLTCDPNNVIPCGSNEYPMRAERPLNSRLNTGKLEKILTNPIPHWKTCVDGTIDELITKDLLK